ncbi:RNase A-like domain-containing protein [Streptomyces sp. NPDC053431]|uniref:RNase A-like domain-containing protein n=1 Tax=Streptomyces sp. NPDC053431 TaxID=3365703 RepID=UPI0037CD7E49
MRRTARAGPDGEHAHAEPQPDRHRVAESQLQSEPPAHDHADTRHVAPAVAGSVLGHAQPPADAVAEPERVADAAAVRPAAPASSGDPARREQPVDGSRRLRRAAAPSVPVVALLLEVHAKAVVAIGGAAVGFTTTANNFRPSPNDPLLPGMDGDTIDRHVGLSPDQLRTRVRDQGVDASAFPGLPAAQKHVQTALNDPAHIQTIEQWTNRQKQRVENRTFSPAPRPSCPSSP